MKTYYFEVSDGFFPQKFSASFKATTQFRAENKIRMIYAEDLGTTEDQLIVKLVRIE